MQLVVRAWRIVWLTDKRFHRRTVLWSEARSSVRASFLYCPSLTIGLLTRRTLSIKKASADLPALALIFLVRMRGLEPPRCHHHRLLRPARLPVPPHPRGNSLYECLIESVKPSRCVCVLRSRGLSRDSATHHDIAIDQLNTLGHSSNGDDSNSHSCHIDFDIRRGRHAEQARYYQSDFGSPFSRDHPHGRCARRGSSRISRTSNSSSGRAHLSARRARRDY